MTNVDAMKREAMLASLEESTTWDVVVIGGGATGLGAALEAASRGHRTALVEAADFAKGTSSRSTKLIHGGVRYLRSGQISMVRESLRERSNLLRNAPHLVQPLRFAIPCYRRGSRLYYFAGMKAYDFLAGMDGVQNSSLLSKADIAATLPTLATEKLRGGVSYTDCQFDDARLAIDLAKTIADHDGVVLNYAKVVDLATHSGKICGVTIRDEETGRDYEINTRAVVNATGVFSDGVMKLDESMKEEERPQIIPSQGSHVVLPRKFLSADCAMMIPDTDDGRVLFAIPWQGCTLLGTTDHLVEEVSLEPRPLESEIDYLLEHADRYFTTPPQRSDVLSVFSGLRPLVGKGGKNQPTSTLSREHHIKVSPAGMITVIGGKWTTYRQMGEDVIDQAESVAGLKKRQSITGNLKLHGCKRESERIDHPNEPSLSVYGSDVAHIQTLIESDPSLGSTLHQHFPFVAAQVVWAVRHEMARTIEDVLSRRLRALLLDARAAIECAPSVGEIMQNELDESDPWKQTQIANFNTLATRYVCD